MISFSIWKRKDGQVGPLCPMSEDKTLWIASGRNLALWNPLIKGRQPYRELTDNRNELHPFIAFLSYLKGKKAMPRVFVVINADQRLTILTMIIAHLQQLDVIARGRYLPGSPSLPPSIQESIETFLSSVIPPIVPLIETSQLGILIGLMGILLDRNSLPFLTETKIGLAFLTLLLSRSQIIFNGDSHVDEAEVSEWKATFDKFFAEMNGHWSNIFPPSGAWGDDMYVWQFLASVAVGAGMEQQHVLVTECRYHSHFQWS